MSNLKQKIKQTALFTPDEKVEILTAIDNFSELDSKELESIIDEYDSTFKGTLSTFRKNMYEELDSIQAKTSKDKLSQMKQAIDKIKSGLDVVTTA